MIAKSEFEVQKLVRTVLHALRHDPRAYGLDLDAEGWALAEDLLLALRFARFRWYSLQWHEVEAIIGGTAADRFQVQNGRIRATYGHTLALQNVPPAASPPQTLFHGTAIAALPQISSHGLLPVGRRFVHLTTDLAYAAQIAATKPDGVVLIINAETACEQGICFRKASCHVWLAENVPPTFIEMQNTSSCAAQLVQKPIEGGKPGE